MTRESWRIISPDPSRAQETFDRLGHIGDQLRSALDDQMVTLGVIVDRDISGEDLEFTATAPGWAEAAMGTWKSNGMALCEHLAHTMTPRPLWMVVWKPGIVLCTSCMADAEGETNGTVEDGTCDGCRRFLGELTPAAVTYGNLSILGGLCDDCLETDRAQRR